MSDHKINLKPTYHVMALCDDMFQRKAACGENYPSNWRTKTREKLQALGLVDKKGRHHMFGDMYYFTEAGLAWYLEQRPQHKLKPTKVWRNQVIG